METQKIPAGRQFIQVGQPIDTFWYVNSGKVQASFEGGTLLLPPGSIIGIADIAMDCHCFTYTALDDVQLTAFGSKELLSQKEFLETHPDHTTHLSISINGQTMDLLSKYDALKEQCATLYLFLQNSYAKYREICSAFHVVAKDLPEFDEAAPLVLEQDIRELMPSFQSGVRELLKDQVVRDALKKSGVLPGYLYYSSETIHELLGVYSEMLDYCSQIGAYLFHENRADLFDLLTDLFYRIGAQNAIAVGLEPLINETVSRVGALPGTIAELAHARMAEHQKRLSSLEQLKQLSDSPDAVTASGVKVPENLINSLNIILEYADCMDDVSIPFKNALASYKKLEDKNATTPEVNKLRQDLSSLFFQIYEAAFQVSLADNKIPTVLKMFFNFGFVDPELTGMEYASNLYDIADSYTDLTSEGIYTIYDWLLAIYRGEKEPSITELDSNYEKHIQELLVSGKINKIIASKMQNDAAQKVMFELQNMFRTACKITNGHLATFCPVLSEHQLVRQPLDALLHADNILKTLDHICDVDARLFYHDAMTVLSEKENIHDYFHVEIRPDVILTPVVGTRGAMWQEISGRSQLTPARMLLPVFLLENLQDVLLHMCGEYRWELCKRVQGSHWNDVSEPSLTSLYYDYLQFFRHNSELSSDAKEKIKVSLQKCKQNFREYFIRDYMIYVLYEGNGSPRLNKVARNILFTQCPFKAKVRESLTTNPLYSELLEKHNLHAAQRLHQLKNLKVKLENLRQPVPLSVVEEMEYCNM